jgi:hypothetical protein
VSDAYCAVLYAARAALSERDRHSKTHRGTWAGFHAHAYRVVAGLRFDTSLRDPDAPGPSTGPRWSRTLRESAAFVARHPAGY